MDNGQITAGQWFRQDDNLSEQTKGKLSIIIISGCLWEVKNNGKISTSNAKTGRGHL